MKIKFFLLLFTTFSIFFYQCTKTNIDVKQDFDYAIQSIMDYQDYQLNYTKEWYLKRERFDFSENYLMNLTGIKGSYVFSDGLLYYKSQDDCDRDIKNWKIWFKENKHKVTKEHSDSIKCMLWNLYKIDM